MLTCYFCNGPRINSIPIAPLDETEPEGGWRVVANNSYRARWACRSCGRSIVGGTMRP